MSSFDVFGMCVRNLIKRKLRTCLTMLGVTIGTAAIVIMISLALASNAQFDYFFGQMDMDLTLIQVDHWPGSWQWCNDAQTMVQAPHDLVMDDDAIEFISRLPGVHVATPIMQGQVFVRSGPYVWEGWSIRGVRAEALPLMGYEILEGRMLTAEDSEGGNFAAVFGYVAEGQFIDIDDIAARFSPEGIWTWTPPRSELMFQGEDMDTLVDIFNDPIVISYDHRLNQPQIGEVGIEEALRPIRSFELNVVGRLARTSPGHWPWPNQTDVGITMDIEVLQAMIIESRRANRIAQEEQGIFSGLIDVEREIYNQAIVRAVDVDYTSDIAEAIRNMGFNAWYQTDWLEGMQQQQRAQMILLGSIGGVSLFVAAIGIANTMIMAVYERTREIGVMKVIGASIWDIKRLFLLESALLGFLGGLLGIGLSYGGAYLLNNTDVLGGMMGVGVRGYGGTVHAVSLITPWLVGMAMAFASSVGLVSGYFPARRATKLSALAAIRND